MNSNDAVGFRTHNKIVASLNADVARLSRDYAAALEGLKIANRSADDQMWQKRAALSEVAALKKEVQRFSDLAKSNAAAHNRVEDERFALACELRKLKAKRPSGP